MPKMRILTDLKDQIHFITFTVERWYYLFDRHSRFEILEQSFVYCQKNKGLKIYAFVFMLNHLHFIASAEDLAGVIRDMKKFLAKEIKRNILATEPNVLKLFEKKGIFHLWQDTNCPKMIETDEFFRQKAEYIQNGN